MQIIHLIGGQTTNILTKRIHRQAFALANWQVSLGNRVSVWALQQIREEDDRFFALRQFSPAASRLTLDPALLEAMEALPIGQVIFHLHGGCAQDFFQIQVFLHQQGHTFIFSPHGSFYPGKGFMQNGIRQIQFHTIDRLILKEAAGFVCQSTYEGERMTRYFPGFCSVIPLGSGERIGTTLSSEASGNDDRFVIGYAGYVDDAASELVDLIKAYVAYQQTTVGPLLSIRIVGEGPGMLRLRALCRELGDPDGIAIVPMLTLNSRSDQVKGIDLFFHPMGKEGLFSAVLDAARAGIPLLVHQQTAYASLVRQYDAGMVLVDYGPKALAELMKSVETPGFRELLETKKDRARLFAGGEFSWESQANKIVGFYRQVLSGGALGFSQKM